MPAYTITPTNPRMQSKPMNVMPVWFRRIASSQLSLLLNRIADPFPERSVTSIKIKPYSHRLTDQILLRDEARRIRIVLPAAVLAVVAIIPHEKIMAGGHHPFAGRDAAPRKHDEVVLGPELLVGGARPRVVPHVLLRSGVNRALLLRHEHPVHVQQVVLVDPDPVARQADQALDVIDFRIRRQPEYDHIAAVRRSGRKIGRAHV